MRPIPASNDASRGIYYENRPAPQQRARFSPQVPDYPIPLNDCSLVLPPLSEYGEEANERRRAGSGGNDGNRGGPAEAPTEPREARQLHMIRQDRFTEQKNTEKETLARYTLPLRTPAPGNQPQPQPLDAQCQHPTTSGRFCRKWALISP